MSHFFRICGVSELPPEGEVRECTANGITLCLANDRGRVTAMDNICPHRGASLGQGFLENGKVVCPVHAWAFDTQTGEAEHVPGTKIRLFEIKVEAHDVLAKL